MSDIKSLFDWGGSKYGSKGGELLDENLRRAILKGIDDIDVIVAGYVLSESQQHAVDTAKRIEQELNDNEERFKRKDPALQGLNTAQWKVFAYVNYDKVQKRMSNGRFDFKFRFVAINMQKPFRYRFDFGSYDLKYGNLLLNSLPIGTLTVRERKLLLKDNHMKKLPQGYVGKTIDVDKHLPLITYGKKGYGNKDPKGGKVMSRRNQTVGNLAAVRLAQKSGRVYPKQSRNYDGAYGKGYAHKIVFWVGHAKRMDKSGKYLRGNRLNVTGYIFLDSRAYSGIGHERYKRAVSDIINKEVNTFMDTLW